MGKLRHEVRQEKSRMEDGGIPHLGAAAQWDPQSRGSLDPLHVTGGLAAPLSQHEITLSPSFPSLNPLPEEQPEGTPIALTLPRVHPAPRKGSGLGQREFFPPLQQPKGRATGSGLG